MSSKLTDQEIIDILNMESSKRISMALDTLHHISISAMMRLTDDRKKLLNESLNNLISRDIKALKRKI